MISIEHRALELTVGRSPSHNHKKICRDVQNTEKPFFFVHYLTMQLILHCRKSWEDVVDLNLKYLFGDLLKSRCEAQCGGPGHCHLGTLASELNQKWT